MTLQEQGLGLHLAGAEDFRESMEAAAAKDEAEQQSKGALQKKLQGVEVRSCRC